MDHTERWKIELYVDEHEGRTTATVRLRTRDNEIEAVGHAYRNPKDADIPEIGDELSVARALNNLAHTLFDATVADISEITHRPATVSP